MRGAVGLTPFTVFVAILAGTQFLGILGALLAIPIAAAVQVVITDQFQARREARRTSGAALPGWRWMRGPLTSAAGSPAPEPVTPAPEPQITPARVDAPPARTGWTERVLARINGADEGKADA
jgi:hypothetical protein